MKRIKESIQSSKYRSQLTFCYLSVPRYLFKQQKASVTESEIANRGGLVYEVASWLTDPAKYDELCCDKKREIGLIVNSLSVPGH